jgi:hypothetical protein
MKKIILITILCCWVSGPVQAQEASQLQDLEGAVWLNSHNLTVRGFYEGDVYVLRDDAADCLIPYSPPRAGYSPLGGYYLNPEFTHVRRSGFFEYGFLLPTRGRGISVCLPTGCMVCCQGDGFRLLQMVLTTEYSLPEDICPPEPPENIEIIP